MVPQEPKLFRPSSQRGIRSSTSTSLTTVPQTARIGDSKSTRRASCKPWNRCRREKTTDTCTLQFNLLLILRTSLVRFGRVMTWSSNNQKSLPDAEVVGISQRPRTCLQRIKRRRQETNLQRVNSVRIQVKAWARWFKMICSALFPPPVFLLRISQSTSQRRNDNRPSRSRRRRSLTSLHKLRSPIPRATLLRR